MCKTVPGVYFDASGNPISDELAASAGFDVQKDRRERAKTEAIEAQRKKIEAQFADDTEALKGMSDKDLEESGGMEPGALAAPGGDPFIERTSSGEPRVARAVADGPVKEMKYDGKAKSWAVINRDTGETLDSELSKDAATGLLLAEE
jgi:hypothetical protein